MSDEREPNDHSDAALRERLVIAGKATNGPWSLQDKGAISLVYGPNGERIAKAIDNREDTAHIAASSPDVVRADIEEILRLRGEVERLEKEADWLAASAANAGWNGVRVSPSFMREKARKAVKDEENG